MGVGRVVLRGMGSQRGRGATKAIIEDGANIGASTYRDGGGEFHMTLPANHPQAGACEPWLTHYAVEEKVEGTGWVERFSGILSDFDATDNDVVVYGIDYLALLDMVVDSRYDKDAAKKPPPDGSYWSSKTISAIVEGLLNYARTKPDSPVKFIDMGPRQSMPEKITIFSTFVSVGRFVQGLLDSHRQGSGARTRLWVEHTSGNNFRFRIANNPGTDRAALRMEYGGAVQGFNLIGFGQFTTVAHGIGRTQTGGTLFYRREVAPSTPTGTWGAIETVAFYDNVSDRNDLSRRVKQAASTASRVGKRVAMGLKVEGLGPFQGYNICDNIPVQIVRGVVDTRRYGSGWWTIHGVEWRIFPDGHTELTLAVLPKEDRGKPNPNTLVDQEVLPEVLPVEIAPGSVTADMLAGGITGDLIQEGAIDTAQLAQGSVTGAVIEDGAITDDDILNVGGDKITGDILITASEDEFGNITPDLRILAYDADGNLIGEMKSGNPLTGEPGGFVMADLTFPQHMVRLSGGVIQYSVDSGATWLDAIVGTGTIGDSITSGVLPGGHNVIPNAGFEMAPYATSTDLADQKWPSELPWGTTIGTDVNLNKGGASLAMTSSTY